MTMATDTEQDGLPSLSEAEQVYRWRMTTLLDADYPPVLAEQIAGSDADLHRAVELVLAGCDHKTASEILL